eukprot:jgi/Chrzof1/4467/Cz14g14100.t1
MIQQQHTQDKSAQAESVRSRSNISTVEVVVSIIQPSTLVQPTEQPPLSVCEVLPTRAFVKMQHPSSEDESDTPSEQYHTQQPHRLPQQRSNDTASSSGTDSDGSDANGSDASDGSDLDLDERTLEQQVADIPFEVLEQLKQDGMGPVGPQARAAAAAAKAKKFKRENRHRPQELSSKRPVPRFREVIQIPKT